MRTLGTKYNKDLDDVIRDIHNETLKQEGDVQLGIQNDIAAKYLHKNRRAISDWFKESKNDRQTFHSLITNGFNNPLDSALVDLIIKHFKRQNG